MTGYNFADSLFGEAIAAYEKSKSGKSVDNSTRGEIYRDYTKVFNALVATQCEPGTFAELDARTNINPNSSTARAAVIAAAQKLQHGKLLVKAFDVAKTRFNSLSETAPLPRSAERKQPEKVPLLKRIQTSLTPGASSPQPAAA